MWYDYNSGREMCRWERLNHAKLQLRSLLKLYKEKGEELLHDKDVVVEQQLREMNGFLWFFLSRQRREREAIRCLYQEIRGF